MLTLKCIDEKIKKLENEAKAIILKALHGEHSWQKARNLEKTILNEIKRLKTEKLKKIKGAEDFVDFVLGKRPLQPLCSTGNPRQSDRSSDQALPKNPTKTP